MKKFVGLLLVMCGMLSVISPACALTSVLGPRAAAICEKLNVYKYPNLQSEVLYTVQTEHEFILYYKSAASTDYIIDNGFAKVYDPKYNVDGWVDRDLVAAYPQHLIIGGDGVDIYSSRSQECMVTKDLDKGTRLLILETSGDHYEVSYNSASGWISKRENVYMEERNTEYRQRIPKEERIRRDNVIAYAHMSTISHQVKTFKFGDTIQIVDEFTEGSQGWYAILVDDRYAYIKQSAVRIK